MLKLVKDFTDKINLSISELKMPNLEQFLSKHYATSSNQGENICKYCEKFIPKSLSQHYRYCFEKKEFDDKQLLKQQMTDLEINIPTTNSKNKNTKKK